MNKQFEGIFDDIAHGEFFVNVSKIKGKIKEKGKINFNYLVAEPVVLVVSCQGTW